ncbi:subtilisin-like serine-protease S isoform X2 [Cryptomeria japonica]|uniref:subtilisin-like serine-protease S isoform X2 n=1 Tax=Cryptomeria japonica TaxID=3369 RepID=UPI0027DA5F19|nr:subtilisin-like serine-protease S isoform X2 [Cryptomeria japonica]XP_059077233.1 subtilisin-like serine-protease S isoform X2 [Cryptomeria japonica]XP_059077234.1 subtilisin-like serine-protease S isoform X2 [Cryptomeria japonica]XP_059077235.1 subtilisin-like serine-protease S isoform X2 [Cryptomeria japonica]XP_059077236.1 subtilisin-like serine-protease S isoform X2 [Cryptomeria japonica]XP_059077237.1 subtilisin-like serine-protease S isoform X2 [Cryptomeria japonica]
MLRSDANFLVAFDDATNNGGVFVSTSTRNSGMPNTATNVAPWIFIVAASSIDRSFKSNVLLKSNITLQGEAVNPITQNGFASLVLASNCAAPSVSQTNASFMPSEHTGSHKIKWKST